MKKKYIYQHWGICKRQTIYSNGVRSYLQGFNSDGELTQIEFFSRREIDSLIHALITLKHRGG